MLGAGDLKTSVIHRTTTRVLTFGDKHIQWWSCVVLLACSCSEYMCEQFRTTFTRGTNNIVSVCVRIFLNRSAESLDGLVHDTLRTATSGVRCNVRPACQSRVGNAFSTSYMVGVPLAPTVFPCEMAPNRQKCNKRNNAKTVSLEKKDQNQPTHTRIHTVSCHMNTCPRKETDKHE